MAFFLEMIKDASYFLCETLRIGTELIPYFFIKFGSMFKTAHTSFL